MMEDKQISDFAAQLESAIYAEDVYAESLFVKIVQHGGGSDESHIRANRAGYLYLASLFLRAAIAPYKVNSDSDIIDIDANIFINEDSDVYFQWLERSENIEKPQEYKPSFLVRLLPIGCGAIAILLFTILIIGAFSVIGWIFFPR